jgi:hypothetical protein
MRSIASRGTGSGAYARTMRLRARISFSSTGREYGL